MFAEGPDGVGGGLDAVLEDAGVGALGGGGGADVEGHWGEAGGLVVAEHIDDGDAGEVVGAEGVDAGGAEAAARDAGGAEGLLVVAVELFTEEAEGLLGAEVGFEEEGVVDREDVGAGVEALGEAGDVGVGEGGGGGIVLEVVLEGDGIAGGGVVIEVGDGLVGDEVAGAGDEGVVGVLGGGEDAGVVGNEPFAGLAVDGGSVEEGYGDVVDVGGGGGSALRAVGDVGGGAKGVVREGGEAGGGTVGVGEADGNVEEGVADFGVGDVEVLVAEEEEELVFDDRAADGSAGGVAMELRDLLALGNVGVLLEEEGRGVEPIGAAMAVGGAVEDVGAGGGGEIDVGAGGRALFGVVHGGVDADLFDGFGGRCGEGVADGEIDGGGGLDDAAGAGVADAGVVDDAGGGDLGGGFAVEEVGGVDAVQEKGVGGVALAVGPDGLVAEAGVGAGAAGEFGVDAGGEDGEAGEGAGGERCGFDLGVLEDVAVSGVDGVEQGRGLDGDGFGDGADGELGGQADGAVCLDDDAGETLLREALAGEGEGVGADGEVGEAVGAGGAGLGGAGEAGAFVDGGDSDAGDDAASRVRDGADDVA